MTDVDRRDRRPQAAGAGRGAEGLVLVRLGQLRLHDHHRHGLLRRPTSSASPRTPSAARTAASTSASVSLPPGSLFFWLITFSTILSALVLPPARRRRRPDGQQEGPAGALRLGRRVLRRAALLRHRRQLAARRRRASSSATSASARAGVVNDSILPLISDEDERDRVSSRGWAFGYLGGGLLLVAQPRASYLGHDAFGLDEGMAVAALHAVGGRSGGPASRSSRSCGSSNHPPRRRRARRGQRRSRRSFGQLCATLRDLRNYPMALTFLLAYLFFNDGIQTVIASASVYGAEELGFDQTIADRDHPAGPVRRLRRRAALRPARRPAAAPSARSWSGSAIWMVIVDRRAVPARGERRRSFLVLGVAIGIVLGGTQALARSYFSPAHPPRQGGGVLQLLPRHGPRHVVVRHRYSSASSTSSPTPTGRRSSR